MLKKEVNQKVNHVMIKGLLMSLFLFVWCEIFLQIGIFYWSGKPFTSLQPYVWSPYGLVRNNPKLNSPAFSTSSNGFREIIEYDAVKPTNTVRVMLLGGSVLYSGLGGTPLSKSRRVNSEETISQFLTAELVKAPVCKNKNIEVINAAINFNRIAEITPAYLNEYINWNPDLVIVGSSINNFSGPITPNTLLLGKHPWEAEFQRLVNDTGLMSSLEVMVRRLSDNLAVVAIAWKTTQKIANFIDSRKRDLPENTVQVLPSNQYNSEELNEENLQRFASYAGAIVGAANARSQKISFFWEHHINDSAQFKPLSNDELILRDLNPPYGNPFYQMQLAWLKDFAYQSGVGFIDPQVEMMGHEQTIFIDYGHYTAEGNAFMAKVIAARILNDGICTESY